MRAPLQLPPLGGRAQTNEKAPLHLPPLGGRAQTNEEGRVKKVYKKCVRMRSVLCTALLVAALPLHGQQTGDLAVSDSLFAQGVALSEAGQWEAAATVFIHVDSLDRLIWPEGDIRRDYAPWWAAYCLCQTGDTARARTFHSDNYAVCPPERQLLRRADSLFMAATTCVETGDYSRAYQASVAAAEASREAIGDSNLACVTYLETAGACAYYVNLPDEAAAYMEAAMAIAKRLIDESHPVYSTLLSDLNVVYQAQGRLADALRMNDECLAVVERTTGSDHPEYSTLLANAASLYAAVGNYREAVRMGERALETCAEEDVDSRVVSLNNQTLYYSALGQCHQALRTGQEAVRLSAQLKGGTNHPDHAFALYNLATVEEKMGLYADARAHYEQSLDIRRRQDSPISYAQTLMAMAAFEALAGNHAQALAQAGQALNVLEQSVGRRTIEYAHALNSLSLIHSGHGDYAEARRVSAQALALCADILGERHPNYALALSNYATILHHEGNYTDALSLTLRAREIFLETVGTSHPHYALALGNIASILFALEDYERSLAYQQEAADITLRTTGELSPRYVGALANISQCYAHLAQVDSALIISEQVLALREKLYGTEHPDYVSALSALASLHHLAGHQAQAVAMQQDVLARTERLLGTVHPNYCEALQQLCIYESAGGQAPAATRATEGSARSGDFISRSFADMNTHSRRLFWQKYRGWFECWVHRFAAQDPSPEQIANAYDAALTSKGLLLSAERAFGTLIQESGDTCAQQLYEHWHRVVLEFDRQLSLTRNERTADLDSLRQAADALEAQLIERSKEFGNFLGYMSIRWTDIAALLGEDEAAIEFVAYPDEEGDMQYVAYTLRRDGTPRRTALCKESQLLSIDYADLYTTDSLTRHIWAPLAETLATTRRIYFAPSGELHNLAIEWLPTADGGLLCERVELRRLSSTRELVLNRQLPPYTLLSESRAAVFGGLTYEEGLPTLPGSRAEALAVAEALGKANCEVQLFTDSLGTAEALTSLSGQHLQLLHLSTHGYYHPSPTSPADTSSSPEGGRKERAGERERERQRVDDLFDPRSDDEPLQCSGLLLASSDASPAAPSGFPDGERARAEEGEKGRMGSETLATLDLRGMDLVVLSACRSGLGEVTGDGVFGLQRAFKKAGARTLMMALWDVSDQVTALFMPQFYENLAHGLPPYSALRSAQEYLRTQTPFTEPIYWAPFVLLDALTPPQDN